MARASVGAYGAPPGHNIIIARTLLENCTMHQLGSSHKNFIKIFDKVKSKALFV